MGQQMNVPRPQGRRIADELRFLLPDRGQFRFLTSENGKVIEGVVRLEKKIPQREERERAEPTREWLTCEQDVTTLSSKEERETSWLVEMLGSGVMAVVPERLLGRKTDEMEALAWVTKLSPRNT